MGGIRKASSARTCSGPNQGEPLEPCGHRVGSRDRLIAPTVRKMSPRLSPAAAAIIDKAQDGKVSIADVPHCTGTIRPPMSSTLRPSSVSPDVNHTFDCRFFERGLRWIWGECRSLSPQSLLDPSVNNG